MKKIIWSTVLFLTGVMLILEIFLFLKSIFTQTLDSNMFINGVCILTAFLFFTSIYKLFLKKAH